MPSKKIYELLERERVPYEVLPHAMSITAQETAEATRIPGAEFAKVTILKANGRLVMAVLPAGHHVDLERMRLLTRADRVTLASEDEFVSVFPDCERGAEPPFGSLYGLDVYVDASLSDKQKITFNAGTHREAIRIDYETFHRLVRPVSASFAFVPLPSEAGAWGG
jgi:Ala-tRNA(Pro) deacylase